MRSRSRTRYRGASSQGNAATICCAVHAAVSGALHSGLASDMSRIRSRTSLAIAGRPGLLHWLRRRQCSRQRLCCHAMTVRGWTNGRAPYQPRTPVKYCPFPPGGGRLGWGGRGRDGRRSHAWPHPHPCPPPSRGRESARTDSPIDYLTDVLAISFAPYAARGRACSGSSSFSASSGVNRGMGKMPASWRASRQASATSS